MNTLSSRHSFLCHIYSACTVPRDCCTLVDICTVYCRNIPHENRDSQSEKRRSLVYSLKYRGKQKCLMNRNNVTRFWVMSSLQTPDVLFVKACDFDNLMYLFVVINRFLVVSFFSRLTNASKCWSIIMDSLKYVTSTNGSLYCNYSNDYILSLWSIF